LGGTLHTQTRAARQSIADIASSANIVSRSGPPPSLRITHQPHHASRNQQRQRLRLHASNLFQCGVLNASRPCCSRDTLARSHNPRASTLRDAGSRLPLHAFLRTAAPTRTATLICSRPICSVRKTPPGPAATAIRALSHALRPSPQVLGSQAAKAARQLRWRVAVLGDSHTSHQRSRRSIMCGFICPVARTTPHARAGGMSHPLYPGTLSRARSHTTPWPLALPRCRVGQLSADSVGGSLPRCRPSIDRLQHSDVLDRT